VWPALPLCSPSVLSQRSLPALSSTRMHRRSRVGLLPLAVLLLAVTGCVTAWTPAGLHLKSPTSVTAARLESARGGYRETGLCRLRGGAAGARMDGGKDVQFVTNKMCPFAQKVWVCLEEKKVDYDLVEVGLYGSGGKPDWFMKLNPKGLVPVLKHGSKGVTESNDVCRYIDANFGAKGSLSPGGSSEVDAWLKLMDSEVLPAGKAMVNGGSNAEAFHQAMSKFESKLKGPFLLGDTFSLADVTASPMMWRIMTEKRLGVTEDKYPKTAAWMDEVKKRPSFAATVVSSWWWWW